MKTEISSNGVLRVEAESELESFALRHWSDDWINHKSILIIDTYEDSREIDSQLTE